MARRGGWSAFAAALLFCLAASLAMRAGDFWIRKAYQNWSADQTQRILEESPWATTLKLTGLQSAITSGDSPNDTRYRGEMESNPSISYTLQFRSALPIRQAEVRASQLNSHYDAMNPDQKATFDAGPNKFLATPFPDRVLVSVTFHTNVANDESLLRNYWASQSVAKLSMTVFLDAKKDRLALIGYSVKDNTFQFTFPRPREVQQNDKLDVEFVHPRIGAVGEQSILEEFSVKKMLVDGQPSF